MIRDAPSSIHVLRFDGSRRAMILALAWSEDFHSSSIAWSWKIISLKELAILRRRKAVCTCPGTSSHTRQYCSGRRMLRFISRSNRGDNTAIDPALRAREAIAKAMALRDSVTPRERLHIEAPA